MDRKSIFKLYSCLVILLLTTNCFAAEYKTKYNPWTHQQDYVTSEDWLSDTFLLLDQSTPQTIASGIPLMTTSVVGTGSEYQLVNKEYVDLAVSALELTEFFHDDTSDIGGIYYVMDETPDTAGTVVKSGLSAGNNQAMFNFATLANYPHLDRLLAGVYDCHFHAYKSNVPSKTVVVYFELYKRTSGGVETLLATSETSSALTTTSTEYSIHCVIATEETLDVTDRLVIKWYANVSGGGADVDITFDIGGTKNSHFSIKINAIELENIFWRNDGSSTAAGDWDIGTYDFTADIGTFNDVYIEGGSGLDPSYFTYTNVWGVSSGIQVDAKTIAFYGQGGIVSDNADGTGMDILVSNFTTFDIGGKGVSAYGFNVDNGIGGTALAQDAFYDGGTSRPVVRIREALTVGNITPTAGNAFEMADGIGDMDLGNNDLTTTGAGTFGNYMSSQQLYVNYINGIDYPLASLDMTNGYFVDTSSGLSFAVYDRQIYSSGADLILDWATDGLADFQDTDITTTGIGTFGELYGGIIHIDASSNYLANSVDGNSIINADVSGEVTFANHNVIFSNNPVTFSSGVVIDDGTNTSIDPYNRTLHSPTGSEVFGWGLTSAAYVNSGNDFYLGGTAADRKFYDNAANAITFISRVISDGSNTSIDPYNRVLYDDSGGATWLDWSDSSWLLLATFGGFKVSSGGWLFSNGGTLVFESGTDVISDGSQTSIDPYNRLLYGSDGTTKVFSWNNDNGAALYWTGSELYLTKDLNAEIQTIEFYILKGGNSSYITDGTNKSIDPDNRELYGTDGTTVRFDWSVSKETYSISNYSADRALDGSSWTVQEIVDVLSTLIYDLQQMELID